jgi:hypothetical protein
MLILGGRYGSIDPVTQLSYTELEYDYAVSKGKPTFAVVIKTEALESEIKALGSGVLERERIQRLLSSFVARSSKIFPHFFQMRRM